MSILAMNVKSHKLNRVYGLTAWCDGAVAIHGRFNGYLDGTFVASDGYRNSRSVKAELDCMVEETRW